jgi:hypothetical protein
LSTPLDPNKLRTDLNLPWTATINLSKLRKSKKSRKVSKCRNTGELTPGRKAQHRILREASAGPAWSQCSLRKLAVLMTYSPKVGSAG